MSRKVLIDPAKATLVDGLIKKAAEQVTKADAEPPSSGVDLKDLLGKTRTILWREVKNLLDESSIGLLSKDSSQSLVNYIKTLKELIKEEDAVFDDMTDEELEELLKNGQIK